MGVSVCVFHVFSFFFFFFFFLDPGQVFLLIFTFSSFSFSSTGQDKNQTGSYVMREQEEALTSVVHVAASSHLYLLLMPGAGTLQLSA